MRRPSTVQRSPACVSGQRAADLLELGAQARRLRSGDHALRRKIEVGARERRTLGRCASSSKPPVPASSLVRYSGSNSRQPGNDISRALARTRPNPSPSSGPAPRAVPLKLKVPPSTAGNCAVSLSAARSAPRRKSRFTSRSLSSRKGGIPVLNRDEAAANGQRARGQIVQRERRRSATARRRARSRTRARIGAWPDARDDDVGRVQLDSHGK